MAKNNSAYGHYPLISTNELKDLIADSYQKGNDKEIERKYGLQKDRDLSTNQAQVYTDSVGNPIITFRGSKTAEDWLISDVALALGLEKYSPRFQKSQKLVETVENKFHKPVTTLGHSLGGSLSEYSNPNGKVITVDKGVGLGGVGKHIGKNQTDIRATGDIISLGELTQQHDKKIINILRTAHIVSPLLSHNADLVTRINTII